MTKAPIPITITKLEMRARPTHVRPQLPHSPDHVRAMLMKLDTPPVHFYRYLYDAVGSGHVWVDRKRLSDQELLHEIRGPNVEIWVLYVGGAPAGYFEVDARGSEVAELKYFGLVPEFQGRGLGKWLMAEAIKACWVREPKKVIVNTLRSTAPPHCRSIRRWASFRSDENIRFWS